MPRDVLIRIEGSVLDTQFTQSVSTMKIECAEAAICAHDFVSVAISNPEINKFEVIRGADYYRLRKSKIGNRNAGVVQWQNGSFPSCTRGFDSPHPLFFIGR